MSATSDQDVLPTQLQEHGDARERGQPRRGVLPGVELQQGRRAVGPVEAAVLAGAALLALDVAVERWQAGHGTPSLEVCLVESFDVLERLRSLG